MELNQETENAFYAESKDTPAPEAKPTETKPLEETKTPPEAKETEVKETAPSEETKAPEEVVEYKLTLPKETFLDAEVLKEVEDFAKANKLTPEAAQNLLEKQDSVIAKFVEAEKNSHEKQIEAWREEVISDPVFGGDNLKKMSENAKRVVEKFGSENFKNLLRDTGYGDHPEVFKFVAKLGSLMDNDSLVLPNAQGNGSKSIEDIFYGKN